VRRGKRAVLFGSIAGTILLLPGALLLARAGWVHAKGAVGEVLIHRALVATLTDGKARTPWSSADMHPMARLTVPRLAIERPVLSNASGEALAFGIGHVDGTAPPAAAGNCVLAGHRDSFAAFLADLRVGDAVVVEAPGRRAAYRVVSAAVVRFDDGRVLRDEGGDRLTLVTCWPFRGWLHSPWRYVVRGERMNRSTAEHASFKALPGASARYQAYRASGLGGIAPFISHT
jgi:sortase A